MTKATTETRATKARNYAKTKFLEETERKNPYGLFPIILSTILVFSLFSLNSEESITLSKHEEETSSSSSFIVKVDIDVDAPLSTPANDSTSYMPAYLFSSQSVEEEDSYIVPIETSDIGLLVQAVQHEVGASASYYPDDDLDVIQQCMTRVIINRIGKEEFADSIYEILSTPGHFMPLEELTEFDSQDERTTQNVLTVLNGEDNLSEEIIFEMSFVTLDIEHNLEVMEEQVGPVDLYMSATTADGRCLIFAAPETSNL